jgi:hypothetical protein
MQKKAIQSVQRLQRFPINQVITKYPQNSCFGKTFSIIKEKPSDDPYNKKASMKPFLR